MRRGGENKEGWDLGKRDAFIKGQRFGNWRHKGGGRGGTVDEVERHVRAFVI